MAMSIANVGDFSDEDLLLAFNEVVDKYNSLDDSSPDVERMSKAYNILMKRYADEIRNRDLLGLGNRLVGYDVMRELADKKYNELTDPYSNTIKQGKAAAKAMRRRFGIDEVSKLEEAAKAADAAKSERIRNFFGIKDNISVPERIADIVSKTPEKRSMGPAEQLDVSQDKESADVNTEELSDDALMRLLSQGIDNMSGTATRSGDSNLLEYGHLLMEAKNRGLVPDRRFSADTIEAVDDWIAAHGLENSEVEDKVDEDKPESAEDYETRVFRDPGINHEDDTKLYDDINQFDIDTLGEFGWKYNPDEHASNKKWVVPEQMLARSHTDLISDPEKLKKFMTALDKYAKTYNKSFVPHLDPLAARRGLAQRWLASHGFADDDEAVEKVFSAWQKLHPDFPMGFGAASGKYNAEDAGGLDADEIDFGTDIDNYTPSPSIMSEDFSPELPEEIAKKINDVKNSPKLKVGLKYYLRGRETGNEADLDFAQEQFNEAGMSKNQVNYLLDYVTTHGSDYLDSDNEKFDDRFEQFLDDMPLNPDVEDQINAWKDTKEFKNALAANKATGTSRNKYRKLSPYPTAHLHKKRLGDFIIQEEPDENGEPQLKVYGSAIDPAKTAGMSKSQIKDIMKSRPYELLTMPGKLSKPHVVLKGRGFGDVKKDPMALRKLAIGLNTVLTDNANRPPAYPYTESVRMLGMTPEQRSDYWGEEKSLRDYATGSLAGNIRRVGKGHSYPRVASLLRKHGYVIDDWGRVHPNVAQAYRDIKDDLNDLMPGWNENLTPLQQDKLIRSHIPTPVGEWEFDKESGWTWQDPTVEAYYNKVAAKEGETGSRAALRQQSQDARAKEMEKIAGAPIMTYVTKRGVVGKYYRDPVTNEIVNITTASGNYTPEFRSRLQTHKQNEKYERMNKDPIYAERVAKNQEKMDKRAEEASIRKHQFESADAKYKSLREAANPNAAELWFADFAEDNPDHPFVIAMKKRAIASENRLQRNTRDFGTGTTLPTRNLSPETQAAQKALEIQGEETQKRKNKSSYSHANVGNNSPKKKGKESESTNVSNLIDAIYKLPGGISDDFDNL